MIAYAHTNSAKAGFTLQEGTLAIELPSKKDLQELFSSHSTQLLMKVGKSKKHPKDAFNKKVGRTVSELKMVLIPVTFRNIDIKGVRHVFNFNGDGFSFSLSTIAESPNVHLTRGSMW